jgi:antitoxin (DNA-binding transcriptional repressor) of toxin-antitoxin stability system
MKSLTIRQTRQALSYLESLLESEGELTITRRGRPIARVTQIDRKMPMPSHRELRNKIKPLSVASENLIREDRNAR